MLKNNLIHSIEEGEHSQSILEDISEELRANPRTIVILDDDPTGTQTVHDVPVITSWDENVLENEIVASPVFFILTNSRSLQIEEANKLGNLIGLRLQILSKKHNKQLLIISRGDSTLRGHYPNEVIALSNGLNIPEAKHLIIPAFFEGGRYTYNDIHYVREGNNFIPAAETPFSKDNTFGYSNSNLKDWIVEKYKGKIKSKNICSLPVDMLRNGNIENLISIIGNPDYSHVVVNATSDIDLQIVALTCLKSSKPLIFRTGASFVNAIAGISKRACLTKHDIIKTENNHGGLIVVGSYVPKSTIQLNVLKEHFDAKFLELDLSNIYESKSFYEEINKLSENINQYLKANINVVLYTSRKLIKGKTKSESLNIVNMVSNGLIQIIKQLKVEPKYIISKGGITSSDIATKGLNVKRAEVLGQALKGIPVWKLGLETKFANMPYIIFPGNVGDNNALNQLTKLLQ